MSARIKRLVILRDAIATAHAGKYTTLAVRRYGDGASWNPDDDSGWQAYTKARREIGKYPLLEKFLTWVKAI